jgi:hypothetical protein
MRHLQRMWNVIVDWCGRACTYLSNAIFGEPTPQRTKTETVHSKTLRGRNSRFQSAKCAVYSPAIKEEIDVQHIPRLPYEKQSVSTESSNLGDDFELL